MKSSRLRVLLLADSVAFHTERIATELRRQGCRVMVASLEHGRMHHFHLARRGPIRFLHYTLAASQVRRLIERFQPDIINAHFASGYGHLAALARGRRNLPILLHLWGSDILIVPNKSPLHRLKTKRALQAADFVLGDSTYLIEAASKLHCLKQSRVIVWGVEKACLGFHRESYALNRPLKVIVPRTQARVYNNEFILRALRPLIEDGRLRLTFPDFGPLAADFRRVCGSLVGRGVELYERTPRRGFMPYVASHDVYLSASRSDSSPASLIEAMALGLIPVAADITGVREWLSDDNGFLFRQDDEAALRARIKSLIESGDTCERMRRRNLERVKNEALFEDNIAETIGIMRDLVAGRVS